VWPAQLSFVQNPGGLVLGTNRDICIELLKRNHYTHSVSSGKSYYFKYEDAVVSYSIPANCMVGRWLLGFEANVWELSRLWAPDGHRPNLLTQAISETLRGLREIEPDIDAAISYADPNVGHEGGVYRAASWLYLGQAEEGRYYQHRESGQVVARRRFHSGSDHLVKAEIEALGYNELLRPGKHRFARLISRRSKRAFSEKWGDYREMLS
jgi:hypothetical protein